MSNALGVPARSLVTTPALADYCTYSPWLSKKRKKTVVVFIYIVKAFNWVWDNDLIYKLISLKAPPPLVLIIWNHSKLESFLSKPTTLSILAISRLAFRKEVILVSGSSTSTLMNDKDSSHLFSVIYEWHGHNLKSGIVIKQLQSYLQALFIWLRK